MSRHVVVVGAGIVGLSAAEELAGRGFRVTVLERDAHLGGGCSFGNGGLVVPSHFVPLAAPGMVSLGLRMMMDRTSPFGFAGPLDLETLGWMARFARAANRSHVERCAPLLRDLNVASRNLIEAKLSAWGTDVGFARRGLLLLSRTQQSFDAEAHLGEQAAGLGLVTRALDPAGLKELDPGIAMEAAGGVYFEDDAHLSPPAYMAALRRRIESLGVELRLGVQVDGAVTGDGRVDALMTSKGDLEAEEFVLAAGAWSGRLGRHLGLTLPMLAGRGFGFTVLSPPERPSIPSILTEARVAMTPMPHGVRFVGAMELGPPTMDRPSARLDGMRSRISGYYPVFTAERLGGPSWSGLRPCSPDGLPYLGRTRSAANLVVATGHAMMGMSLGPITGRLVAECVAGDDPSIPIDLLSPDRYA